MRQAMKQGTQPKEVPQRANRGGEAPGLRERLGAEPCIWTDRMLAALVNGVKGGRWFSLKDKLYREETLRAAAEKVCSKRSKGKGEQRNIERFDFLGYRFVAGKRYVRVKSLRKLRESVRRETKRTNGHCMPAIIATLNPILRGWFGYYQHAYGNTFPSVDGWVRMRLRSILRKRQKKRGRGRGRDHQKWPNRYFAEMGLFSPLCSRLAEP